MKAVNLASKPFVNRRPVIRIAFLVWIAAIVLAVVNIWSYGDFFRVASDHRARLADLEKEIRIEEEQVKSLEKRIAGLKLDDGNTKARYLNGLIHQRIFPWSRLFDEIQDVLPKDVYLVGLAPQIEKVESQKRSRTTSSANSNRTRNTSTASNTSRPARTTKKKAEPALDRVLLELQGFARSDEAMLELVDRLYASPSFLDPTLSSESRDNRSGLVAFQIEVTYLTGTGSGKAADVAAGGDPAGDEAGNAEGATPSQDPGTGGNLYGQPGFSPPTGTSPGAPGGATQPDRRPASRPGFEPNFAGGGTAASGTATSGTGASGTGAGVIGTGGTAGRGGSPTQPGQPGFVAPGQNNANPQRPQDGGTVVVPRRFPGALGTTPSSSPRLGAGGG